MIYIFFLKNYLITAVLSYLKDKCDYDKVWYILQATFHVQIHRFTSLSILVDGDGALVGIYVYVQRHFFHTCYLSVHLKHAMCEMDLTVVN